MTRFIQAGEVADLLELDTREQFLRRRAHLEDLGFPHPVGWVRCPLRWRRSEVVAWLDAQSQGVPQDLPDDVVPLATRRLALHNMARSN